MKNPSSLEASVAIHTGIARIKELELKILKLPQPVIEDGSDPELVDIVSKISGPTYVRSARDILASKVSELLGEHGSDVQGDTEEQVLHELLEYYSTYGD